MTLELFLLIAFALLIGIYVYGRKSLRRTEEPSPVVSEDGECDEACGLKSVCEGKEKEIVVYFEDEELDQYKGRDADSYASNEIEQFKEVLDTLQLKEVAIWLNSLCARGVALPRSLRAQAIALRNEARNLENNK